MMNYKYDPYRDTFTRIDETPTEEQYAGEDLPEEDLISCENCGKVIKGYGRMSASEVLSIAQKKYGGCYCADCMTKSAK